MTDLHLHLRGASAVRPMLARPAWAWAARLLLATLLMGDAVAEDRLATIDFSAATARSAEAGRGRFSGALPDGCHQDFAGWNRSVAVTEPVVEDGRTALSFRILNLDQSAQFRIPVVGLQAPGRFRLRIACRAGESALGLGIRQIPSPYATLWSGSVLAPGSGWCERSFVFSIDKPSAVPLGIFLYPGTGRTDIAEISLSSITASEFAATIRRPDAAAVDLLRHRRFPFGLPNGWSLASGDASTQATADGGEAGVLHVMSGTRTVLSSEPFQVPDPAAEYEASFRCRCSGTWTARVASRSTVLADRPLAPSPGWTRVRIPFAIAEAARMSPGFQMQFDGTGDLRLDDLRIVRSGTDTPPAVDLALAVAGTALAESRVQFIDEPAMVRFAVSGLGKAGVLRSRIADALGEMRPLPDHPLAPAAGGAGGGWIRGTIDAGGFPEAPLGQFRIEAWVEQDGRPASPIEELLLTRIRHPRHQAEDAGNSPFGAHVPPMPRMIRLAKAAGINWARFHDAVEPTAWSRLEPSPGAWSFHDDEIAMFRSERLKVYAGLSTAPLWASTYADSGKTDVHPYFDRYFQPKDLQAWETYVRTVVGRYRGVIDTYFIWNEPWGLGFWHTGYDPAAKAYLAGATPAADYARLSGIAYRAAKAADPKATVVGFNTAGDDWTRGVLASGGLDACDAVDYHFYTTQDLGFPGDPGSAAFATAVGAIRRHPAGMKPVYLSEGQGNSNGMNGFESHIGMHRRSIPWDSDEDPLSTADRTCRFVMANLAAGADKVFLYSLHGHTSLLAAPNMLTLVAADGFPHLELAAFSNLAWQLEDSRWQRTIAIGDGVFAFLFAGRDGAVAVISGRRNARLKLPVIDGGRAYDLFGNALTGTPSFAGRLVFIRSDLDVDSVARQLAR